VTDWLRKSPPWVGKLAATAGGWKFARWFIFYTFIFLFIFQNVCLLYWTRARWNSRGVKALSWEPNCHRFASRSDNLWNPLREIRNSTCVCTKQDCSSPVSSVGLYGLNVLVLMTDKVWSSNVVIGKCTACQSPFVLTAHLGDACKSVAGL